jgi:AraC-like DNA-binding protein
LTLCYTDVLTPFNPNFSVVTADGNLMMVSGNMIDNNFKPSGATWLLHVSSRAQAAGMGFPWWGWALIVLAIAALATGLVWLLHRRKSTPVIETETPAEEPCEEAQEAPVAGSDDAELMQRICQAMEQQQLFMNPNLKITDLATALGTNRSAISACINSQRSCSFPQFVNTYRVAYAQELLRSQPDIKIAEVCVKSGFSGEASFYRIFKAITGTTPSAWKNR